MAPRPRIEVVAAVLQRADGAFLLAQRPAGKVYAGYWEFPGGKVEPGESPPAAVAREIHEELDVRVTRAYPWIIRDYDYEHAAVRLRFFRVTQWSGELHGRENQAFAWQRIDRIDVAPLLPANGPILRALALPPFCGVSNAGDGGVDVFLRRLERALERGLKLVQLREKTLQRNRLDTLVSRAVALARSHGARVVVNADPAFAAHSGADGVHLSASRLMTLDSRPDNELVGASCHDVAELAHAAHLGVDYAIVGPVAPTATHPDAVPLGWERFERLIADCPVPVYAIGGLGLPDLERTWRAGAHGIAAIRAAWR